ncbi:MAG: DUF362 domain-containing protein, partial [Gemmatimonadota bacterium]|nr:DUF362 domain-containing protein [Gemmatimonadota bacterium]
MPDRRSFVRTLAGATAASLVSGCREDVSGPRWHASAAVQPQRSTVAVLKGSYEADLGDVIRRGMELMELDVRGLRVVVKPNFVEFDPGGVINTHPAVVHGTIEALRRLGADSVVVAEGAGHRRDTEYLLRETGIGFALRDTQTRFVDLNHDSVHRTELRARFSRLGSLYLPDTVLGADLLISLPKLKMHHWAGVTLSMKNMFGIVPGSHYGWPKNVLHWAGINESILDINATLTSLPRFAIVDGIVGMEGNGPIQGEPRPVGALVFGADPVAVDATGCRLMRVDPGRIDYLVEAGRF